MGANNLLGIFLIIMGIGMVVVNLLLKKNKNIYIPWIVFGVIYAIDIVWVLGNSNLKSWLNIDPHRPLFAVNSIIIMIFGIALSFVYGSRKGERNIILGIIFTIGVHFIPFQSIETFLLSTCIIVNALYGFLNSRMSTHKTLTIDAIIKIIAGAVLLFL